MHLGQTADAINSLPFSDQQKAELFDAFRELTRSVEEFRRLTSGPAIARLIQQADRVKEKRK